jgi:cell shape-determining protein MreC
MNGDTIYLVIRLVIRFFLNSLIFIVGIDAALTVLFPQIPQTHILMTALVFGGIGGLIHGDLQSLEQEIRELKEKLEEQKANDLMK